jgi:hypothetical protein
MEELQITLPVGYEPRRLDDGDILIYAPESIRHPETGEWLGRRTLLKFMPEYPGIAKDVEILAYLDSYAQGLHPEDRAPLHEEIAAQLSAWRGSLNA